MKKRKHSQLPPPQKLRLQDNHSWTAPDGYKIAVLDRGAVSFNFPASWHLAKLEPFELNDKQPPDDDARISVSFWRLPSGVDWSGLPLVDMLVKSTEMEKSDIEILARGEIVKDPRTDLELVWTEHRFMDPKEHREAYTRIALGRGWDVQVLITCDFWVTDAERLKPIWAEVMRSLQLGRVIQDPTKGVTLH
jgi:hypothetical protein